MLLADENLRTEVNSPGQDHGAPAVNGAAAAPHSGDPSSFHPELFRHVLPQGEQRFLFQGQAHGALVAQLVDLGP